MAAIVILNKKYPPLSQHAQDDNLYILNQIGEYNIIIACFSVGQMGNNSAAIIAA
jgi:hypothetical protein